MKVSILIPVYNVEQYLPQCLDSIIHQTYHNLQIVLIDDGSKDRSWDVMQKYAVRDKRIEIYQQENQGVAVTRNNLLEKIRGDYVLFIDSDDWIELDMVDFLIKKVIETKADVVTCAAVVNDTKVNTDDFEEETWSQETVILEFLKHVRINGSLCNKLVKSSLLHKVSFHCGISYGEDALFCWQLLQKTKSLHLTNKQLYHYRMNENSISHQEWMPEKKGTGHMVWEHICQDTAEMWSQYSNVSLTRYALEDMWALYFASHSGYKYDRYIEERQRNVRQHLFLILKSDIASINMKLYAVIASLSYGILKFIKK